MICKHCDKDVDRKEVARVFGQDLADKGFCSAGCYTKSLTEGEDMRPVRFGFDEVGPFDGFTDGSTWNGWLNVWTTPEVHAQVVAKFKEQREASNLEQTEEDAEFVLLDVSSGGLVSYANGFTTSEWTEDKPTPYQAWVASRLKVKDLGKHIDEMDGCEGLLYAGGWWIEAEQKDGKWIFSTIVSNGEIASPHLGAVEWWLWENWAKAEGGERPPLATKPDLEDAIRVAQEAFWAEIAKQYPTATSGDFPPDASMEFDEACTLAVKTWTHYNVKEKKS